MNPGNLDLNLDYLEQPKSNSRNLPLKNPKTSRSIGAKKNSLAPNESKKNSVSPNQSAFGRSTNKVYPQNEYLIP
jgi:hypothetical protein